VLYGSEDLADRIWRGPQWARPAVGGLLLGLLLFALPELYGVGYPVLSNAVDGRYAIDFVALLLLGKIVATSLTIAIGGSGGVFAPSLFMGAMLGSGLGQAVHGLLPGLTAPAGAYALVGMGAVFAGAARAPITAVIIIFELTGNYSIILPLMFAIVVATGVSGRLSGDTIYTLKLRRRGIAIDRPRVPSVMQTVAVSHAMTALPDAVEPTTPVDEVMRRLTEGGDPAVPVVDADGALVGIIGPEDIATEAVSRDGDGHSRAADLAHTPVRLRADETLEQAVRCLARTDDPGLPVLAADGQAVVGWVTHRDVLRCYHRGRERLTPR
jgi:CIC family chloride channel protein